MVRPAWLVACDVMHVTKPDTGTGDATHRAPKMALTNS
jgi:hypothetical protein